jgi:exo-1,4-beta-D-glucosaminidase
MAEPRGAPSRTSLDAGWAIRSSTDVHATPAAISRPGFSTASWYPVTLPSTVLGALVADGQYANPYIRTNLAGIWP